MSKNKPKLTDEQVELEIIRIRASYEFQLAEKEKRVKNKRRQYLYWLRQMEKRGKQLAGSGVTFDNIEEVLFGEKIPEEE